MSSTVMYLRLKYTFLQLDKGVKKSKSTRTTFDITGSTTALTGSISIFIQRAKMNKIWKGAAQCGRFAGAGKGGCFPAKSYRNEPGFAGENGNKKAGIYGER